MAAKGAKGQVCIQFESSYGVSPAADALKLHFVSCGLRRVRPFESDNTIQSNRNPGQPGRGVNDIAGPLVMKLQAFPGQIWKWILGSANSSAGPPYTHTIKVGDLPSAVVDHGFTDIAQYFLYNGVKVNKASMNVTAKGLTDLTLDLVGNKETTSGSAFDATPTDLGKVTFDGYSIATIEEGNPLAAIATIIGIDNLTIENDLDTDDYTLGNSGNRASLDEGMVKVSGVVKVKFADLTLYNKAVNHTESAIRVVWQNGTGAGTAGNEYLEIKIPELVYSPQSPIITGPKGVYVELPFEGYYGNAAEASSIQVIIKNTQASL
jgi:hypothetical protein